jgi:hypothetical protein
MTPAAAAPGRRRRELQSLLFSPRCVTPNYRKALRKLDVVTGPAYRPPLVRLFLFRALNL